MEPNPWNRLVALAGANLAVFVLCYGVAAQDTGANFSGLGPAVIATLTLVGSAILTAFGWNQLLMKPLQRSVRQRAVLAMVLAAAPLLFYLFGDVIPHRLKSRLPDPNPRSALNTRTALCFRVEAHRPAASECERWAAL